jgi:ribosomal protein L4
MRSSEACDNAITRQGGQGVARHAGRKPEGEPTATAVLGGRVAPDHFRPHSEWAARLQRSEGEPLLAE